MFLTLSNLYYALSYIVIGTLLTEFCFWVPGYFFEYFAESLKPYKIRNTDGIKGFKESQAKLRKEAIDSRVAGYKTDWIIYLVPWLLSSMSFDSEIPSFLEASWILFIMILVLDTWIFLVHLWLHSKYAYNRHKYHHSFRHVTCWFVDMEDPIETVLIGGGKHINLVLFSPHPYIAFVYLFITKLWNVLGHCGYNLPPFQFIETYLPLIASPNGHELHHYEHVDINFSVFFTWLDYLFGTLVLSKFPMKLSEVPDENLESPKKSPNFDATSKRLCFLIAEAAAV